MPEKIRQNQNTLDLIEKIKTQLKDQNPRNFGLYMKLHKKYGAKSLEEAAEIAAQKESIANKLPYFIGILKHETESRLKNQPKMIRGHKEEITDEKILKKYQKLRKSLLGQMTPLIQKRAKLRSKIMHKASQEERKHK